MTGRQIERLIHNFPGTEDNILSAAKKNLTIEQDQIIPVSTLITQWCRTLTLTHHSPGPC
ncbi:hypothetical protein HPB48_026373 [Haemaphysalis longicornis]|uniref:Uncharacterized protein n=1 Tax=Haemaphysalis longicornis TaxID=44386 RepID=A0A9J6H9D4_HAELO|nr:hypothetical protein HPB48_026373 [Haemaphysalis longicornis]